MKPKFGVVVFPGSNCDHDAYYVLKKIFNYDVNFLWHKESDLQESEVIILPGGFSYGDYLRSGSIARFSPIMNSVIDFANKGGTVLGICNGFQIITQMGILPGFDGDYNKQLFTLAPNDSSRYEDRWVHLKINPDSPCVFTQNIKTLFVPVRHGEGKISSSDKSVLKRILDSNQGVAFYMDPSTGSVTDKY
ncbi:MAG: phosphoribosylformylglycinamidine synthase subunit PurQ, partial [Bacteroidetes bacterium]|nr:phosphoribosylformylglycinamidine synthase subunit PurQ [Bacteroidota bacterium]